MELFSLVKSLEPTSVPDITYQHSLSLRHSLFCFLDPAHTIREKFENGVFTLKRMKCFPPTLHWRNLKMHRSPVISDLCSRKTRSEKSRDYRDVIVFKKLRFQNGFHSQENEEAQTCQRPTFSNSSGLNFF